MAININIFYLLEDYISATNKGRQHECLGTIKHEDVYNTIKVFKKEKFNFLDAVYYSGFTIFNKLQVKEIKKEINDKVIQKAIPGYVIELINNASDQILKSKNDCYLVFDGE